MQMLVVGLILMSRTRAYPVLRIGVGFIAGIAFLGWMFEGVFNVETPVDTIVNTLARHALPIAITLFAASVGCKVLVKVPGQRGISIDKAQSGGQTAVPMWEG